MATSTTVFEGVSISHTAYNLDNRKTSHPVLVFVHGWCCSSALWSGQERLYTRHPSILIDLPGHGKSEKPENVDYSVEYFAKAIHAVLEDVQVNEVVLIGHSMGGVICTMFLRLFRPSRVRGIVYVSSFWLLPAHYMTAAQRAGWASMLTSDDGFMGMFESSLQRKADVRSKVREVMLGTPLHVRLKMVTTNAIPHHWTENEIFSGGQLPLLHITYEEAPEWDSQFRRHLPDLRTEKWNGVGIFLFMEEPDRFNERIEAFLEEGKLKLQGS